MKIAGKQDTCFRESKYINKNINMSMTTIHKTFTVQKSEISIYEQYYCAEHKHIYTKNYLIVHVAL